MKKSRRKLDKNKVYMRIGQVVVYSSLYVVTVGMTVFGFMQNTIY